MNTKPVIIRYKKPRRIKQFCEDTGVSKPTVWRRIKDQTLQVEYLGHIPLIVGGPAGLCGDKQAS
jgi:hypothetical protein